MIRPPWQRTGGWSPEEAAAELQARRAKLISQLRRHSESRGVPLAAQEEIVDDAIATVVMSPRGTANEDHLIGAFWIAVNHRCARYREGRPFTRLGSRHRVDFDSAMEHASGPGDPLETVELTDRMARAADLIAELDAHERQILTVMVTYGIGPVPTARRLGLPLGEVRAADRSIKLKLERVAAIAAAGRMCEFRSHAILADAVGEASDRDAVRARAHVNACVPCGRVYRKLRREMRSREFQRAAAAAFLPLPAVSHGHVGGLGKLAAWIQQHLPSMPHAGGERTAEVFGGAGAVKVAALATAAVIAGGTLTSHIVHSVIDSHAPAHHHAGRPIRDASQAYQPVALAKAWADPIATDPALATSPARHSAGPPGGRIAPHGDVPAPPSKSLGYLALGRSSASTSPITSAQANSPAGSVSSTSAHAMVASVDEPASSSASTSSPSSEPSSSSSSSGEASQPSSSGNGGGGGLGYLGQ